MSIPKGYPYRDGVSTRMHDSFPVSATLDVEARDSANCRSPNMCGIHWYLQSDTQVSTAACHLPDMARVILIRPTRVMFAQVLTELYTNVLHSRHSSVATGRRSNDTTDGVGVGRTWVRFPSDLFGLFLQII